MKSKKALQKALYGVREFDRPKIMAEQYCTLAEIASDLIWKAFMLGDIEDKHIADLGAGTGILGIGCILMGAKKAWFVEQDSDCISALQTNLIEKKLSKKSYEIVQGDIRNFNTHTDTVIMNPPFGTKDTHADKGFLKKAIDVAPVVYSFHKSETFQFIKAFTNDNHLAITHIWNYKWQLKPTMGHHKKRLEQIGVVAVRLEKK